MCARVKTFILAYSNAFGDDTPKIRKAFAQFIWDDVKKTHKDNSGESSWKSKLRPFEEVTSSINKIFSDLKVEFNDLK